MSTGRIESGVWGRLGNQDIDGLTPGARLTEDLGAFILRDGSERPLVSQKPAVIISPCHSCLNLL